VASEHRADGSLASAEQTGDPSLAAAAHTHLAWVLAHVGDVAARPRAELAWEYFSVYEKNEVWVWYAAVTLAWLRATTGDGEGLDDVLAVGVAAWKKAGQPPFEGGALLFEFDHYPTLLGALERQGVQLDREAGRALDSANRVAAAAAHGCLARHLRRGPSSRNRHTRVALHFARAVELLREAGATAAPESALAARLDAYPQNAIAPPAVEVQSKVTIDADWVRLAEVERRYIADVLRHTHGRITGAGGAAAILGLNPSTLSWRIDKLGLREILTEARRTAHTPSKKAKRAKG
jgi:hypothetical protein